ncbi:MAG: alpha-hydroxy-acid oxidizing protein, partial [Candidatus Ranarchaeia archaeon]
MKSSNKIKTSLWKRDIDISQIKGRKTQHVRISLTENVQARSKKTGFNDIHFIHRAVPEIDYDDIDTGTKLFGRRLDAPIIISAMTGGSASVTAINKRLAKVAAEFGLGMGVGSQRAAIKDSSLRESYAIAREMAPENCIIGNLGGGQLATGWGINEAKQAVDMIEADALAIHLNTLHEVIQPEGECFYRGLLSKISDLSASLDVPIIAKETGAGICREDAESLIN